MREIVLDSSALVSLSDSCLFNVLRSLHEQLGLTFFIPKAVEKETVITPLEIKRFELNAVRIRKGISEGWLKVRNVSPQGMSLVNEILHSFNNLFFLHGRPLNIIQLGEIEALALVKDLNAKVYVVDERTTRMLIESPQKMRSMLEQRHKTKIKVHKENLFKLKRMFNGLTVVRSTEIIALAFKKGILALELQDDLKSLEAALYSVKFNGCSVSEDEITAFLKKAKK